MKLFNSLTNKKEDFKPIKENEVSIYVCGPTVYNYVHVGNTRPMIVFDVLRRVFEYRHFDVKFVSNFTDVDDKIIQAAKREGISEKELTTKYIDAYNQVRHDLNLMVPTKTPLVTETMDKIIEFIDALVKSGYAYELDGDVYFRVTKVDNYGQLSGIKIEDLVAGASERVDTSVKKKEHSTDFALWKKTDEGIQFDSPWSKGRPGWHSECVVMINDFFKGQPIDIHGGGQDLKFPHHENEIAQSMALYQHPIAHTWMHNQMITVDNEKMSKSLGNVLWAKDMIVDLGINVHKWLMLSSHYRNPLNLSDDVLTNVKKEVAKVENIIKQIGVYQCLENLELGQVDNQVVEKMVVALEDDLNTSLALTTIIDQVKVCNQLFRTGNKDQQKIMEQYGTLLEMTKVIGFDFKTITMSDEDKIIYQKWNEAKKAKEFDRADQYRSQLIEAGIL